MTKETRGSDMMPNGWNSGTGVYVIHYRNESSKEKVYMLKALAVDNSLFIQLMVCYFLLELGNVLQSNLCL